MTDSADRPAPGPEDPGTPPAAAPDAPEATGRPAEQAGHVPAQATGGEPPRPAGPDLSKPAAPGTVPPPPPAPGAGYPPPGYPPVPPSYGYPAGPGWGPLHPAPKPGVIPLRPLDLGDLFSGTFSAFRRYWRPALVIAFTLGLISGVINTIASGIALNDPEYRRAVLRGDFQATEHYNLVHLGGSGLSLVVNLAVTVVCTSLLIVLVSHAVLGRATTLGQVVREALPSLPRMLGLVVMSVLIVAVPMLLCGLPGLVLAYTDDSSAGLGLAVLGMFGGGLIACWLYTAFSLAAPALVLERQGVFASLGRSYKLVKGSWWRVFGIELLVLVITFVAGMVVNLIIGLADGSGSALGFNSIGHLDRLLTWHFLIMTAITNLIVALFSLPVTSFMRSLLYMDLRIRREELDIELAAAAGLPNPRAPF